MEIYVVFVFTPTLNKKRACRDDTLSLFFRKYMRDFQEVYISELLSEHLSELLYLFHGEVVVARLHLLAVVTGEDA